MISLYEHRLIRKGTFSQWMDDTWDVHIKGPWDRGDNIAIATSPFVAGASAVFRGPDALIGEVTGEKPVPLPDGLFAYTRRDVNLLLGNVLSLNPGNWLRAVGNGIALLGDVPMDTLAGLAGHTRRSASAALAH